MNDRELLELAAKAAGREVWFDHLGSCCEMGHSVEWNPLTYDSDALRLAVKLEMDVFVRGGRWSEAVKPMGKACKELHDDDPYAATRRAIVRAAAEIGRSML